MKIPYFGGRLLQQEATIFLIISLDTAGLWRRVRRAGISKTIIVNQSSAIVSSDRAYQNSIELFIPIVHALRNNLGSIEKYFDKMAASYMAQIPQNREFFIRL